MTRAGERRHPHVPRDPVDTSEFHVWDGAETHVADFYGWPNDPRPLRWRLAEVLASNLAMVALAAAAGVVVGLLLKVT